MAFRKTSYSKVFVDDAIPSFLVQRETSADTAPPMLSAQAAANSNVLQVSPALNKSALTAAQPQRFEAAPAAAAATALSERRNRSLQLRPAFMLRVIAVAIALNVSLHLLLTKLPPLLSASPVAVSGGAQPAAMLAVDDAAAQTDDADALLSPQSSEVITYQSNAEGMLHYVGAPE